MTRGVIITVFVLLFSPLSCVVVPALVATLILIDPYSGVIISVLLLSVLIAIELPSRYRPLALITLPASAIILGLGDDMSRDVIAAWALIVAAVWHVSRGKRQ